MKIKVLWGFEGNAQKLGSKSSRVRAGEVFNNVDDDYAHVLIGKGLVEEVASKKAPRNTKAASPAETKQPEPPAEPPTDLLPPDDSQDGEEGEGEPPADGEDA